jgi:transposase
VPRRKTDKADARWLATRMRDGWLQASFIPSPGQRELRELTCSCTKLVQEHSREVNRVQGVLERATIKLAAVARDLMGVSGRAILAVLIESRTDPATMAALAKGRWRRQIARLEQALTGLVRDHHRRLLASQLAPSDVLDEPIEALSGEMRRCLTALRADDAPPREHHEAGAGGPAADPCLPDLPLTFMRAIALLATMPGVDQRGAERWVAATGIDMARVGTASRRAVWAGVAPGHDASAGTQRSGRTRPGNQPLRTVLTQLAHTAARTKGTSLSALYHRLAARWGKQRAIVAVAHSMVVSAFHLLSRQEPDQDLGATDFDAQQRHHPVDRLTRRIEHLGYRVHLEPVPAARFDYFQGKLVRKNLDSLDQ